MRQPQSKCPLRPRLRQALHVTAVVFCFSLQCPYPVSLDVLTVSSIVPELLTPHTAVADSNTTSNHLHTTSNQTQLNQTTENYTSPSDVFSRGNQFYPTTPTRNEWSCYSTSQWDYGNHCTNTPTHVIFGQTQQHRSTTSLNHTFTPNNAAHFSSVDLTPNAPSGCTQCHLTPNAPINAEASMGTDQGFNPMDPENILEELSAMFEDTTDDVQLLECSSA